MRHEPTSPAGRQDVRRYNIMSHSQSLRSYIRLVVAEAMGSSFTRISRDAGEMMHHVAINRPDLESTVTPDDGNHLGLTDDELLDKLEDEQHIMTLPRRR